MPTEIEQIEDLIIAEIRRTVERKDSRGTEFPVIGIADCETFAGTDIPGMLPTIASNQAVRVIYAGDEQGDIKAIGGGDAHDETMTWRLAIVVTNLRSRGAGARAGYAFIEPMKKCFARFMLTPLRGYLHHTKTELLYVGNGKYVYGFELERRINK